MAVPTSMKGRRRPKVPDDPEEFKLTLGEHLDELRTRIVRIALLIFGGWVAGWYAQPWVYRFLNELVHRNVKGHQTFDFKDAF
ncbi:MAG: hypothetical protein HY248_04380, partial [Fimbriimonas ginsengisoli]|nr:hypothetical protein [Fimbriimonas ginsengisoli]